MLKPKLIPSNSGGLGTVSEDWLSERTGVLFEQLPGSRVATDKLLNLFVPPLWNGKTSQLQGCTEVIMLGGREALKKC